MSDTAPARVGPYTLNKMIATGAQSQVWTASGPKGEVVIKRARTVKHREALAREAEILGLGEHKNLATLVDVDADHDWLALEKISGTPIDQWAHLEEPEDVVSAALQLLDAVAYLHDKGIIHGDIKPSNVLVNSDRQLKLLDLGIATRPGEPVADGFKGTLGYAAPELLKGGAPSVATDLYSVGALLYTCLTGRPPFVAADPAALTYLPLVSLPAPPSAFKPGLSSHLNQLVLSLLARNPARRPTKMATIRQGLSEGADTKPAPPVLGMLEEREELRQAVVGAADGEPRVVLLYGPPGCGRRTLISEAVEYARREGLAYLKGSDPREALQTLKKSTKPQVLVMRGNSKGGRKLAQIVLTEGLPCLFLLHSDRPIPALAQRGAIQITPAPLGEVDTSRLARMYGAETELSDLWWRDSLGLPIAVLGRIRAWKRSETGADFDMADLPPDSKVILAALKDATKLSLGDLAGRVEMGEHTVLDHCEVLFAEGLIEAADDGKALRII